MTHLRGDLVTVAATLGRRWDRAARRRTLMAGLFGYASTYTESLYESTI